MNSTLREYIFSDHPDFVFAETLLEFKKLGIQNKKINTTLEKNSNIFVMCTHQEKIGKDLKKYIESYPAYIGIRYHPFEDSIFVITILKKIDKNKISVDYLIDNLKATFKSLFSFLKARDKKIGKRFLINTFMNKEEDSNTGSGLDTLTMTNITSVSEMPGINKVGGSNENYTYSLYSNIAAHIKHKVYYTDIDFMNFPYRLSLCIESFNYKDTVIKANINGYYCDNHQLIFNILTELIFVKDTQDRIEYLFKAIGSFTELYIEKCKDYINDLFFIRFYTDRKEYRKQHSIIPRNFKNAKLDPLSLFLTKNSTYVSDFFTTYFE